MSQTTSKLSINFDNNGGFNEDRVLYEVLDSSNDYITLYDKDGEVFLEGTDDFMFKLGQYLTGKYGDWVRLETSKEITQYVENITKNTKI